MRLLGVDLGKKRIGLAVAEAEQRVISPRVRLEAVGTLRIDAQAVAQKAESEGADAVVVGLPLVEGEEGRAAGISRTFAALLVEMGWTVHLVDESLTSHDADLDLKRTTEFSAAARKKRLDSAAACRILERFLETQA